ncbi:ABC transporter permease [Ktedonobacter sp. SOSP1-52]|uniref:carbohydrate ABC transporter permease n=1 Tax=Ktedonobacter sp. SOSP1-52 TaxID=2778366 RepID=UPI001A20CAE9|nr:carbohydrate ABC transporter permease [Ktedonobacter sp. SOSP1-52]GHO70671.1 ABC transporter permease [Ktedonobacter sp. SOSP1-52]
MITSLSRTGKARTNTRWFAKKFTRFLLYVLVLGGALVMIYPLLWLFSSSFKPEDLIFSSPGLVPTQWTLGNYAEGWNALDYPFTRFFLSSLTVCLGAVVGNIFSCSLAAYAFARLRFKYKPFWFVLMLGGILLPAHVLIVPQYILFKELGWIGTFLPLIAPKLFATDTFFIFLMIQFIRGIPTELDDAARIDGCSHFSFYWRIILPLALPALVTTAIFTFIWTWNDFFSQLIYLSDEATFTIPVALSQFVDSTGNSAYGQLFAMSVLSLLPIFGFFLIFQRLLIQGVNTTGLKG